MTVSETAENRFSLFSVLDPSKKFHLMPWVPGSLKHITALVMWGPSSNTTVTHSASRPLKHIKLGKKMEGGNDMRGRERTEGVKGM